MNQILQLNQVMMLVCAFAPKSILRLRTKYNPLQTYVPRIVYNLAFTRAKAKLNHSIKYAMTLENINAVREVYSSNSLYSLGTCTYVCKFKLLRGYTRLQFVFDERGLYAIIRVSCNGEAVHVDTRLLNNGKYELCMRSILNKCTNSSDNDNIIITMRTDRPLCGVVYGYKKNRK